MKYLRTEYRIEPYVYGDVLKYWAFSVIVYKGLFGVEVDSVDDRISVGESGFYNTRDEARLAIEIEKKNRLEFETRRKEAWDKVKYTIPEVIPYE